MLEEFPNVYKHGSEICYYCLHRMCMYRSTYATENCGNSRCFQSQELCFKQTQPHQIPNTHRTKNNTTDVVIQQHSRKLLMMDILMSETC